MCSDLVAKGAGKGSLGCQPPSPLNPRLANDANSVQ